MVELQVQTAAAMDQLVPYVAVVVAENSPEQETASVVEDTDS